MTKYCPRCGCSLSKETEEGLKDEYPYYCTECDENFYEIEALEEPE